MLESKLTDYIFGYGSLINAESRKKSGYSGKSIPVIVNGIKRAWSVRINPPHNLTVLGAYFDKSSKCNGVIVEIPKGELKQFDDRELPFGYKRIALSSKEIIPISGKAPKGNIWVYVEKEHFFPTKTFPIAQSYVDVVINGCLEINKDFAKDFITLTDNWDSPWINDRNNPKYPRAGSSSSNAPIDTILKKTILSSFKKRIEVL